MGVWHARKDSTCRSLVRSQVLDPLSCRCSFRISARSSTESRGGTDEHYPLDRRTRNLDFNCHGLAPSPRHCTSRVVQDCDEDTSNLRVHRGYWQGAEGVHCPRDEPSDASGNVVIAGDTWEWQHTTSSVINAIIGAGLRLTSFNEHPESTYADIRGMMKSEDGWYRLPADVPEVPMLYSLTAEG